MPAASHVIVQLVVKNARGMLNVVLDNSQARGLSA